MATIVMLVVAGCVSPQSRKAPIKRASPLVGIASWYGPGFHGKLSASGEHFDMWALTAAHRTLPFGTFVRVQSKESGRRVTVRINDRGPFIDGRIIDLSFAAARELGMIGRGTEEVVLTVVPRPPVDTKAASHETPTYWIQVGSFSSLSKAMSVKIRLERTYPEVQVSTVTIKNEEWHRVRIGAFESKKRAQQVLQNLRQTLKGSPKIVQYN